MAFPSTIKAVAIQNKNTLNPIILALLLLSSILSRVQFPFFKINSHYVFFLVFSLTLLYLNLTSFKPVFNYHKNSLFLLGLLYLWMWVGALVSQFPTTAIKYTLISSIYFVLFVLILCITFTKNEKYLYHRIVFRFLVFLALFGCLQYLFPDLGVFNVITYKFDAFYPRISSFMQWPNQFAVVMAIGVSLAIILYKYRAISIHEACLGSVLFIVTISLSGSRNGWLMLSLVIGLLWLYQVIKLRGVVIITALWIFSMLFFPVPTYRLGIKDSPIFPLTNTLMTNVGVEPEITLKNPQLKTKVLVSETPGRLLLIKNATKEIIQRPLTGAGLGVFAEQIESQSWGGTWGGKGVHTHNLILNILVELGIPGLLIAIALIVSLLKKAKLNRAITTIPVIILFASQMADYFMLHDSTFTLLFIYFLAEASNSKIEGMTRTLETS